LVLKWSWIHYSFGKTPCCKCSYYTSTEDSIPGNLSPTLNNSTLTVDVLERGSRMAHSNIRNIRHFTTTYTYSLESIMIQKDPCTTSGPTSLQYTSSAQAGDWFPGLFKLNSLDNVERHDKMIMKAEENKMREDTATASFQITVFTFARGEWNFFMKKVWSKKYNSSMRKNVYGHPDYGDRRIFRNIGFQLNYEAAYPPKRYEWICTPTNIILNRIW
jgi:hypothetical protein